MLASVKYQRVATHGRQQANGPTVQFPIEIALSLVDRACERYGLLSMGFHPTLLTLSSGHV